MCIWLLQISEINIKLNILTSLRYTAKVLGIHRQADMCKVHAPFLTKILDQKKRGTRS